MNRPSNAAAGCTIHESQLIEALIQRIIDAHTTIGRLRYHLERNGIIVPDTIDEKEELASMAATAHLKRDPSDLISGVSLA